MADQNLRERYVQILLDRIRAEPYPSLAQMDLLEATVTSPVFDRMQSLSTPRIGNIFSIRFSITLF